MKTKLYFRRLLSVLLCVIIVFSSFSIITALAAVKGVKSLDESKETDVATLLAGNDANLKGDTLEDTVEKFKETYLLGVASDFGVFLNENFEVTNSDAEGRVAVGGNIIPSTSWGDPYGNYTIGAGDYSNYTPLDKLLPNRIGAATVVLGGELKGQLNDTYYDMVDGVYRKFEGVDFDEEGNQTNKDNFGNLVLTPEKKSTKKLVLNQNSTEIPAWVTDDTLPEESNGNWQKIDWSQTYMTKLFDFDEVFADLIYTGAKLAQNKDDSKIYVDGKTITLSYEGAEKVKDYVYFNLSAEEYQKFQNATYVDFENIPKLQEARKVLNNDGTEDIWEYAYIVVNVAGKGEIHLANPSYENGSKFTSVNGTFISREKPTESNKKNNNPGVTSLLYNFYEADENSTIVIGNNFQGTIFAPRAFVTDEVTLNPGRFGGSTDNYRGHLSGALIANSFKGATQFSYRTFSGAAMLSQSTYNVAVSKVDQENNPVSGAEISIYKIDENGNREQEPLATYTSDETAHIFDNLSAGRYVLHEDKAPENYEEAKEDIYFEIKQGKPVTVPNIRTGEYSKTANIYSLNDIKNLENRYQDYIDAEERETFTWGNDMVNIACVSNVGLIIDEIIFKYADGTTERIAIRNINSNASADNKNLFNCSGWTEIYKWASDTDMSANTQPTRKGGIVSVSLHMKSASGSTQYPGFKIQKLGSGTSWEDLTVTPVYKTVTSEFKDVELYSSTEANFYYKRAEAEADNSVLVSLPWMSEPVWVEATRSDVLAQFTGYEGNLTVFTDETFTEGVTYTSNPLTVEDHVYVIDNDKYTFEISDNSSSSGFIDSAAFKVYKNGELQESDANGFRLYKVTDSEESGYVVFNSDNKIVYPEMTLTKALDQVITGDEEGEERILEGFVIVNFALGDLKVSKTVEGRGGDKDKAFTFTVTLSDKSINGTYGDMTFENGEATITLKDGESKTAEKLPAGITYTVTESDNDGYETTYTGEAGKIVRDKITEVNFTNTFKTGSLTVSKAVEGSASSKDDEFTFKVTLSDKSINGTYGDMTFENGEATITLKGGESKTADELPAGITYEVEEIDSKDYTVYTSGDSGTIEYDETELAAFLNVKNNAPTKSADRSSDEKVLVGDEIIYTIHWENTARNENGVAQPAEITVIDKLDNGVDFVSATPEGNCEYDEETHTVTWTLGTQAANADGNVTVTVKVNANAVPADEKEPKVQNQAKVKIGNDSEQNTGIVEHLVATGNLTVSKTVEVKNGTPDTDKAFTFTVILSNEDINGTYGDITFENGVAEFTLKHGESKTAEGLPAGISYSVFESDNEGYTVEINGETGSIADGGTAKAEFINKREALGSLTVSKTVEVKNGTPDTNKAFTFTVTLSDDSINGTYGDMTFKNGVAEFTLKHGESKTATDLPAGITYTVAESGNEGYTVETNGETGNITDGGTANAEFINKRESVGNLTVSKTVEVKNGTPDTNKAFTFTVTLSDDSINGTYGDMTFENGVAEFTLKHGESKTAVGLPAGVTYTVAESDNEGYTVKASGETGKITDGGAAKAEFINKREAVGNLTVSKTVEVKNGTPDTNKAFTFTVTLRDKSINGTYGDMTFENGVAKFTLKHGESKTAVGLPAGTTYTVTESDNGSYTVEANGETGNITDGGTAKAEFINKREAVGNLTVSKTVEVKNGTPDKDKAFTFTVTLSDDSINGTYGDMTFENGVAEFTLKHGESKTATGLPAGTTYTVTESDNGSYTVEANGESGNITDGGTAKAEFINKREALGNLTVSKTVEVKNGTPDTDKEFTFTVTLSDDSINGTYGDMTFENGVAEFTLKHGESKTATGLPAGVTYTVTESDNAGYTVETNGETGNITDGGTAKADFINKREAVGNLTVSKTVEVKNGTPDADKEFIFTVTLSDDSINGSYGDMTFENGVAEFTLKHGESKTATGLPAGVTYTVTESDNAGYTVETNGETGSITDGGTAKAEFINKREAVGNLTVSKTVEVKNGTPNTDEEFTFTVTLSDDSINGTYGDMTFVNGVAEITLKHGESKTAVGLPAGVTYTVAESNNEGYTVEANGETGSITDGDTAEALFINIKEEQATEPTQPTEPEQTEPTQSTEPEQTEPTQSTKPAQIATPDQPAESEKSNNTNTSNVSVKTGDNIQTTAYIFAMFTSLLGVLLIIYSKKRGKNRK